MATAAPTDPLQRLHAIRHAGADDDEFGRLQSRFVSAADGDADMGGIQLGQDRAQLTALFPVGHGHVSAGGLEQPRCGHAAAG